jgi:hypothetical protein
MVQGNLQRLGALQQVQTTGQEEAEALPLQAEGMASSLLEHPFSTTTSGTSGTSGSTSGSTDGSYTGVQAGANTGNYLQNLLNSFLQ